MFPTMKPKTLAIIILAATAVLLFPGCAGSGENGSWTPQDTNAVIGGVNQALGTYDRYQHPEAYRNVNQYP